MPDVPAVPQATAAEEQAEETQSQVTETPAAAENTEGGQVEGGGHDSQTIPYARFKQVNDERKALKTELDTMRERLEKLEQARTEQAPQPKPKAATPADLEEPPESITDPKERAFWMIQNWGAKAFQEATGISMQEIGEFVKHQKMSAAESEWNTFCAGYGLDPKNEMVRRAMRGAIAAGEDPDAVAAGLASMFGAKPKAAEQTAPATQAAKVETAGLTGPAVVDDLPPILNRSEAAAYAAKGKAAPYRTTNEILAAAAKLSR